MPLINHANLIGLPVVTESGERIGVVRSFDIDIDAHTINRYIVKSGGIVATFSGREDVLIHASQVVRITEKEMTVRDAVIAVSSTEKDRKMMSLGKDAVPILSRDMEV